MLFTLYLTLDICRTQDTRQSLSAFSLHIFLTQCSTKSLTVPCFGQPMMYSIADPSIIKLPVRHDDCRAELSYFKCCFNCGLFFESLGFPVALNIEVGTWASS